MIIHKQILFIITCSITYITILFFPIITSSNDFLNEDKIKQNIQCIQQLKKINSDQKTIIDFLQSALHFIKEKKNSEKKIQEYKKIIDNYSHLVIQLQIKHNKIYNLYPIQIPQKLSIQELKNNISQVNSQLLNLSNLLKAEKDQTRYMYESSLLLSQQRITLKHKLKQAEQKRPIFFTTKITPVEHAKLTEFHAKQSANKLKIIELELAQINTNNQQTLSKLLVSLLKTQYDYTNDKLHILQNQLNTLRYKSINQHILHTKQVLYKNTNTLPQSITKHLTTNHNLSLIIAQQMHDINDINLKKRKVENQILQVHQTFNNLIEQSRWVNKSPALGETLRTQISELPKLPKFQQLNNAMAQLRAKRLQYEHYIHQLSIFPLNSKQDDGSKLTPFQKNILTQQLQIQHKLLTVLLNNYDIQIIELTKLKFSYEQLKDSIKEIQQATHRYLFWIADIHPITISYITDIYHDIYKLITNKILFDQIISASYAFFFNKNALISTIFCIIILIALHYIMKNYYYLFLERTSQNVGKINQDNFLITFYNICNSILVATPIPMLWLFIGYKLSHAWSYPIIVSIGDGISSTSFMLWIFILSFYLSSTKGLFIIHFGWSKKKIQQVFSKHYSWSVIIIIFLTTILTILNNYNNHIFSNTLGRLCFILLCIYVTFITNNIKKTGLPLYLNKYNSSNNIINHALWNIMLYAPITAAVACSFGYLFTAQALLTRLEISLFIWILLLIIYYVIRRWMLIQRQRIAFIRAKKKRTELSMLRSTNTTQYDQQNHQSIQLIINKHNKKKIDLDIISTKSLQLVRSIIISIAILLMILLWSELHPAFSFLENITLWDVTSTIKGVDNIQPITLKTFLTIIVMMIITTIMVRNLPAFLELTLLQHLSLTVGTTYAITTLTKYTLILLSTLIGLSLIEIEWVKIQWLIAALGLGLGFGLQEIFANLISGIIILFEKPIRIGDTITIQNITGNVTHINTRATIITDWDHKEIIIPNKEFITKQFINWSLSDTITRVILKIPAPSQINAEKMTYVLSEIVKKSPLSLKKPIPEVYLISLNQGFPIFEIRTYTADIKSRVPLCHQINTSIIKYYKNHNLQLPCLTLCQNYKASIIETVSNQPSTLESNKPIT